MMRFLADENLHGPFFHALVKRLSTGSIVRVQDVGLEMAPDPAVLEWAALHDRLILTHDLATMRSFAYERVAIGLKMSGVLILVRPFSIWKMVEEIELVALGSQPDDWRDIVRIMPLF